MVSEDLLSTWAWVYFKADWPTAPPTKWSITHAYFAEQWK